MKYNTSDLIIVEDKKDRDIRKLMKLLRTNYPLYLHGIRISYLGRENFRIEYTYNGINEVTEKKAPWVRNFLKKDYLSESVYSVNYD